MMSEIEKATEHMLKVVEILRGLDKRLNNLEGNKMSTEGIDTQEITNKVISQITDSLDYGELAEHISTADVAEHINQADIIEDVAQHWGAEGIAEHVPADQVAEHMDVDYKKLCQVLIQSFMADKECK